MCMNILDGVFFEKFLSRYTTFDVFVKNWINRKNIHKYLLFLPQYKFICMDNKKPLVDFIGYFENLEKDFSCVSKKIGINAKLLFLNKTKEKKNYKSYYSKVAIKIVEDAYREDIQLFGYDFDNILFK